MAKIIGVGDIMLGRGIARFVQDKYDSLLGHDVIESLQGDLITGNLECVICTGGTPNRISHSHFRTEPERATALLQRFHVVNLANNHMFDFGERGIEETLEHLDAIGVKSVGVGRARQAAYAPARFDLGRRQVAVFGATTVSTMPKSGASFFMAKPDGYLSEAVARARAGGDLIVLHLHAGGGDCAHPAPTVRELHAKLLASGVDIIFGHHPHVVQGWNIRSGKIAFFSLGDFIFDKLEAGRDTSLIARVSLTEDDSLLEMIPVRRNKDLRVATLSSADKSAILEHLDALNEAIASGASDHAYRQWYGNPVSRLWTSVRTDYQHGGLFAIIAKIRRLDRHRSNTFLSMLGKRYGRN